MFPVTSWKAGVARYSGTLWLTVQPDQRHSGHIDIDADRVRVFIADQIVADWSRGDVLFTGSGSRYEVSAEDESLGFEPVSGAAFGVAVNRGGLAGRIAQVTHSQDAPKVVQPPPQSVEVPQAAQPQPVQVQILPQHPVPKKRRRWPWVVLGLFGLFWVIGSLDPSSFESPTAQTTRTTARPQTTAAPVQSVTASELYADYDANEVAADQKWKGRTVAISGTVENIGRDIVDEPYVTLEGGDFWSVQCFFADESGLAALSSGETVVLIGVVDGMALGTNVIVEDCRIER